MPARIAIQKLKDDLAAMSEMCEYSMNTALMALLDRDSELACYVIDYDAQIDEMELAVDRDCVELLQSGSLSGRDVRFVAAASKINNDLERIGDQAASICEHVLFLVNEKTVLPQIIDFQVLLEQAGEMIRESVGAVLNHDVKLAWKIIDERKIVDEDSQITFRELLDVMQKDSRSIERCCHILFIVQALHRIADQASNIAEEVIFMEEGVSIKHHIREYHPVDPDAFDDDGGEEELIKGRKSRDDARAEHESARRDTVRITHEEVAQKARGADAKAKTARMNLLKSRNSKRSPND